MGTNTRKLGTRLVVGGAALVGSVGAMIASAPSASAAVPCDYGYICAYSRPLSVYAKISPGGSCVTASSFGLGNLGAVHNNSDELVDVYGTNGWSDTAYPHKWLSIPVWTTAQWVCP